MGKGVERSWTLHTLFNKDNQHAIMQVQSDFKMEKGNSNFYVNSMNFYILACNEIYFLKHHLTWFDLWADNL